ncbi:hypothetical protein ZWY2020_016685 [Hordeum vulgare]|nr:hypothetical protein ZWY2020_016685 [Hordeum vulgare]
MEWELSVVAWRGVVPATNPGAKPKAKKTHNKLPGWLCSRGARRLLRVIATKARCLWNCQPPSFATATAPEEREGKERLGRGAEEGKDDHAAGAIGVHGGYGVGTARREIIPSDSFRHADSFLANPSMDTHCIVLYRVPKSTLLSS